MKKKLNDFFNSLGLEIGCYNVGRITEKDLEIITSKFDDSMDILSHSGRFIYEIMVVGKEVDINKISIDRYNSLYHL